MDSLKEMIVSVCTLSLVIGIVHAIKPGEKYEKQIRLFTACLFLMAVLSPVLDMGKVSEPDWSYEAEENTQKLYEAADEETIVLAEEELEAALLQELAHQSIPCSRIEAEMNILEDMSISITSVSAVSTRPDEAADALRELLGEDVNIYADSVY